MNFILLSGFGLIQLKIVNFNEKNGIFCENCTILIILRSQRRTLPYFLNTLIISIIERVGHGRD